MADRLILVPRGDAAEAQRIIDAFGERTGLAGAPAAGGGTEFPLGPEDHGIKVVETLTAIADDWPEHVALGDPAPTDRPGDAE